MNTLKLIGCSVSQIQKVFYHKLHYFRRDVWLTIFRLAISELFFLRVYNNRREHCSEQWLDIRCIPSNISVSMFHRFYTLIGTFSRKSGGLRWDQYLPVRLSCRSQLIESDPLYNYLNSSSFDTDIEFLFGV